MASGQPATRLSTPEERSGRRRTSTTLAARLRHLLLLRHPACHPVAVLTAQPDIKCHAATRYQGTYGAWCSHSAACRLWWVSQKHPQSSGVLLLFTRFCGATRPCQAPVPPPGAGLGSSTTHHLNVSYCRRLHSDGNGPDSGVCSRKGAQYSNQPSGHRNQGVHAGGHRFPSSTWTAWTET